LEVAHVCIKYANSENYSENSPSFAVAKDKDNKTISMAKEFSPRDYSRVDQNTLWYRSKYFVLFRA
jgi:hypothetical protein